MVLLQLLLKGKFVILDEFWYEIHLGMSLQRANICYGGLEIIINLSMCRNLILKAKVTSDFKNQILRTLVKNVS